MRVTTLKAPSGGVAALLSYYTGLAERPVDAADRGRGLVDYYLDPDEPAGQWWGDGRQALGVSGEVAPEELRSVLEGAHPVTAQRLGKSFGDSSARGFDATFSAPKSVSVLWALTPDPWVRAEVLAAHDSAVDVAMRWFQINGGVTRRGKQGIHQVDTQGVTAALFRQHTSRTVDPQLHTHAVISAKVQDPTGRWLSLDARFLKYQQRTIGWIYDAALRAELTGRLGVEWTQLEGRQAELTRIPAHVSDLFSQRTAQVVAKRDELIERWSRDNPGEEPDARTIAGLERAAVLASRPSKEHSIEAPELHRSWTDQATGIGLNVADLTPQRLARPDRVLADGTSVAVGDRIATRRNDPALCTDRGEPVRNRHVWIAHEISPNGDLTVSDPGRGTAVLPRDYVERHVELGWAVTGYGTQGDTVDVGIAVLEPGTSPSQAYVALTRGREANHAWFPDPTGTIEPADQLEAMVTRTPEGESALATLERLHVLAGIEPPELGRVHDRSRGLGLEL